MIGEAAEYDPQDTAISGAFVGAFHTYIREELKFGQDKGYKPAADFGPNRWDWKHDGSDFGFFPGSPSVVLDLVQAMISNPRLKVEVGIYDLATPFVEAEYTVDHMALPENIRRNIWHQYYEAGYDVSARRRPGQAQEKRCQLHRHGFQTIRPVTLRLSLKKTA